ncbi:MAG: class IV adenylate cyclase [Candidatus Paceibacterota bacterium]|jgi:adenylate cyclase class 2
MEEIEVKFLNIDPVLIEKKLIAIGAKRIFEKLYKRRIFDYPDLKLHKKGAWIRLRDEGEKITLTYKERVGMKTFDGKTNDDSMEEIEINVSDFKKTAELLNRAGFIEKFYQENKRIRYQFGDIEFDIDFWPRLEPYLEIEAPSWERVEEGVKLLGLNSDDKKIFTTTQVYKLKGIEDIEYKEMTFERMIKK